MWRLIFCPCDSKAPFPLSRVAVITLSIVLHLLLEHSCSFPERDLLQPVMRKRNHEMDIVIIHNRDFSLFSLLLFFPQLTMYLPSYWFYIDSTMIPSWMLESTFSLCIVRNYNSSLRKVSLLLYYSIIPLTWRGNINLQSLWSTCAQASLFSCHCFSRTKITRLRRYWAWSTQVKGVIKFKLNAGMSSSLRMNFTGGGGNTFDSREFVSANAAFSAA